MNPEPLFVFALQEENPDIISASNILYTGLGKVQAAVNLSLYLEQHPVSCVINLGTAGSSVFPSGTVVYTRRFIQRDMDCSPLGFEQYKVPYSDLPLVLEYGLKIPELPEAVCGTGDAFDSNHRAAMYSIVDMEAYSFALTCQVRTIPFVCLKYISDGANDSAATDWNQALVAAARALDECVHTYVLPRL